MDSRFRDLQDYRAQSDVLTDAIGYAARVAALDAGGGAERITLEMVTDNYFSLLGVQPAVGRLIQPNEGRARGDAPVVVLAYEYWQSRFAGDPSIVGRIRSAQRPAVHHHRRRAARRSTAPRRLIRRVGVRAALDVRRPS